MLRFNMPNIYAESLNGIEEILSSGWVVDGSHVRQLEEHFRKLTGVKHAIACASATDGLTVAMRAAGVVNQVVGLPAFTWPSTLYALWCNNNIPVFLDIDRETWNLENREEWGDVDAIVPVDCFGNLWHQKTDKTLIIDAACSYGLEGVGKRGLVEVVSLSFSKIVTGIQGGMILTDDEKVAEKCRVYVKIAAKLEEINALVALKSIQEVETSVRNIQKCRGMYESLIKIPFVKQKVLLRSNHSMTGYLFEDKSTRDAIKNSLKKAGMETRVYYKPLVSSLKNSNWVYDRVLALPVYGDVIEHIPWICEIINNHKKPRSHNFMYDQEFCQRRAQNNIV